MPALAQRRWWYANAGKRALDVAASSVALVMFAPVMVGVALAVRRKLGSPVLFRQRRAGRGGRPFTLFKFRTMTDARGPDGELLSDADRTTAFGEWLRASSLDELPELLNVLRGEMSLVGPRPLHTRYLPRYSDRQARRHEVRPGLTGLAQVSGRNEISWEERFELDVDYVDRLGWSSDLRILFRTVLVTLSRAGAHAPDGGTSPEFMGAP